MKIIVIIVLVMIFIILYLYYIEKSKVELRDTLINMLLSSQSGKSKDDIKDKIENNILPDLFEIRATFPDYIIPESFDTVVERLTEFLETLKNEK